MYEKEVIRGRTSFPIMSGLLVAKKKDFSLGRLHEKWDALAFQGQRLYYNYRAHCINQPRRHPHTLQQTFGKCTLARTVFPHRSPTPL